MKMTFLIMIRLFSFGLFLLGTAFLINCEFTPGPNKQSRFVINSLSLAVGEFGTDRPWDFEPIDPTSLLDTIAQGNFGIAVFVDSATLQTSLRFSNPFITMAYAEPHPPVFAGSGR